MRVEVEGKKREKTKLTLPFLFLPFNLSSSSFSSSSSSSNTMLGSAPQLQDAPGVAYLCGDCGVCEKNREELTGDRRFFFFFFRRRRRRRPPMHYRLLFLVGALALPLYLYRSCLDVQNDALSLARAEEWS